MVLYPELLNFVFQSERIGGSLDCGDRCICYPYPYPPYCCDCSPPPPSSECFPATATVSLENGETVTMSELQIGDKVATGKNI